MKEMQDKNLFAQRESTMFTWSKIKKIADLQIWDRIYPVANN